MPTLGVIGTGHLATYVITALRRGGFDGRILLTPRNADRAAALRQEAGCEIAGSAQEVLAGADVVLLGVRPQDAASALAGLTWSPRHTVLSPIAGLALDRIRGLVPGAGGVHLMMPLSYLASVRGPIPVYPPAPPHLARLLGAAGDVVTLTDERAYDACMLAACASTWVYDLADALADELTRHGLDPAAARAMALGGIAGPVGEAVARPEEDLLDLSDSIATEGTYTRLGRDVLQAEAFDAPWRHAIRAIAARLAAG